VNVWDVEAVYFDCALYMFTGVLAVMTFYQLRSAVIVASLVIFPAVFRVIFWKLFRTAPKSNLLFSQQLTDGRYRDGTGNTAEENFSVFSQI